MLDESDAYFAFLACIMIVMIVGCIKGLLVADKMLTGLIMNRFIFWFTVLNGTNMVIIGYKGDTSIWYIIPDSIANLAYIIAFSLMQYIRAKI